jgi:hypothetical protein
MAYSWVNVPDEWWSEIDIRADEPVVNYTRPQLTLRAYRKYDLSELLTDAQRRPTKIRVTYSMEGSVSCDNGYQASVSASIAISGRDTEYFTTGPGWTDPSASATYADSLEDDLLIVDPDYFTEMDFSITAVVYGASEFTEPPQYASGSVLLSVSAIQFYIDAGFSEIWTSFVNSIEENIFP